MKKIFNLLLKKARAFIANRHRPHSPDNVRGYNDTIEFVENGMPITQLNIHLNLADGEYLRGVTRAFKHLGISENG